MADHETPSLADDSAGSDPHVKVVSAGAFDVRSIIGGLLGVYGLVLTITGLWFTEASDKAKADGENLNLLVGIGLLVFAALFLAWVLLRPLKIAIPDE
jgi:glucose uptake protein GlcU